LIERNTRPENKKRRNEKIKQKVRYKRYTLRKWGREEDTGV